MTLLSALDELEKKATDTTLPRTFYSVQLQPETVLKLIATVRVMRGELELTALETGTPYARGASMALAKAEEIWK